MVQKIELEYLTPRSDAKGKVLAIFCLVTGLLGIPLAMVIRLAVLQWFASDWIDLVSICCCVLVPIIGTGILGEMALDHIRENQLRGIYRWLVYAGCFGPFILFGLGLLLIELLG